MSRPPLKAVEQIKKYCANTQCRSCIFGIRETTMNENLDYVGCKLQETVPYDWDIAGCKKESDAE